MDICLYNAHFLVALYYTLNTLRAGLIQVVRKKQLIRT